MDIQTHESTAGLSESLTLQDKCMINKTHFVQKIKSIFFLYVEYSRAEIYFVLKSASLVLFALELLVKSSVMLIPF